MNPQHHPKRIGVAATASLRIERLDPILQLLPGNQPLHLLQEDLPARPPLLRIVLQFRKSHLKLHGPLTAPGRFMPRNYTRLVQSFPSVATEAADGRRSARFVEVTHEAPAQKVFELVVEDEWPAGGWHVYRAQRVTSLYGGPRPAP